AGQIAMDGLTINGSLGRTEGLRRRECLRIWPGMTEGGRWSGWDAVALVIESRSTRMNRRTNSFMMAMALGLCALAPSAAMAQEAAPAVAAPAEAGPAKAVANMASDNAAVATPAPAFEYARPVNGIGQPRSGEIDFQE